MPDPVELEPAYIRLDPLRRSRPPAGVPASARWQRWTVRELLPSPAASIDVRRAVAAINGWVGSPGSVSFEGVISPSGTKLYIGSRPEHIGLVTAALQAAYPDLAIVEAADPWAAVPDDLAIADLYSDNGYHRALQTAPGVSVWSAILQLPRSVGAGEVRWQIICQPTTQPWPDRIAAIHRCRPTSPAKFTTEPIFATVIRFVATTPELARTLPVIAGLFTMGGMPLRYRRTDEFRRVISKSDVRVMFRSRVTHVPGQLLSVSELALLVHLPDEVTARAGGIRLVEGLRVPERLRLPGIPLGVNYGRGIPINVFQPLEQASRSAWVIGATRSGKTTFLETCLLFLARHGYGVGILDPHRTMAISLLGKLAGVDDSKVMFLDFGDPDATVLYHPFQGHHPATYGRISSEYAHSFRRLLSVERFPRLSHFLRMGIYGLLVLGDNLPTLLRLFSPDGEGLRRRVAAEAPSSIVQAFWGHEFHQYRADDYAPLTTRLSPLLTDEGTLRTFSQTEHRVDFRRAMDDGMVVIITLPRNPEAADLLGGIILAQLRQAGFDRMGTPMASRHFRFFVDEVHRFVDTSGAALESTINECEKGGLSLSLAHQTTAQLSPELLKGLYGMANIVVLRTNLLDARQLAPVFNGLVPPENLSSLRTGECYARIDGDIVHCQCLPTTAAYDAELAARIIRRSREQFYATNQEPKAGPPPSRRARVIKSLTKGETNV